MKGLKSIDEEMTWVEREADKIYLRKPLFPVSMRLYKTSPGYKKVIQECCKHLKEVALMEFSDYSKPRGISGANVGIPFNIIGVVVGNDVHIYLNPEILYFHRVGSKLVTTNCGSVRLNKPITLQRDEMIVVEYYGVDGRKYTANYSGAIASTIQHEVDHNLGILITDRAEAQARGVYGPKLEGGRE